MDRATEFLKRAKEAEALAAACRDVTMKQQFQHIADQWRDMARVASDLGWPSKPADKKPG